MLTNEVYRHVRRVYNVLDLLGDLGGVVEIILVFFGIVIYSISKHKFILKASKQFFLARSRVNYFKS